MTANQRHLERRIAQLEQQVAALLGASLPSRGGTLFAIRKSEGDDKMIRIYHDDLDTYPDAFGYINVQKTDPQSGTTGIFDHGAYWDSSNFCFMACYLANIDFYINDAGSGRYVLEMSYDLANFNAPVRFPTFADSSAPNNTTYYSSTQSKLVFKDSGGTVNNLHS